MTDIATLLAELAELRNEFADAHRRGMESLQRHNFDELDKALKEERALIDAQARVIQQLRDLSKARAVKDATLVEEPER